MNKRINVYSESHMTTIMGLIYHTPTARLWKGPPLSGMAALPALMATSLIRTAGVQLSRRDSRSKQWKAKAIPEQKAS